MITIIDYGVGNLASVQNMLRKCGVSSRVSKDPTEILSSTKLILPGVGAFDSAMKKINEYGLDTVIRNSVNKGSLILGICLGAQLLLDGSEEGSLPGLSLIHGEALRFDENLVFPNRVPHMGWSDVTFVKNSHPLASFKESDPRFYFTHSYFLRCHNPNNILATSEYGHQFTCGIVKDNVMGVQFHPEKSHTFGWQLLTNFANMQVCDVLG